MRVAFMGRSVRGQATGVGRYAMNLASALGEALPREALTLFLTRDAPRHWAGHAREVRAPFRTPNEYARALWEQTIVPAQVRRLGADVYHCPNYILPAALSCPGIVTVHDLAYLQRRLHRLTSHVYLSVLTARAIRQAAAIVAVSDYTRKRLEAHYPHAAGRVGVISEAVDPGLRAPDPGAVQAFRERLGLRTPYVLFVGTQEPRKNLVRLVEAFESAVSQTGLPHHLMLVGPRGWKTTTLDATIALSPMRERIHRVGYVADRDLACWYAGADLFVYPSLDEGFGLPPLEAMHCGAPVLTSNRASLPEVVGDGALTVDPFDTHGMATAMAGVLLDHDLAERLRQRGRRRAASFSWSEVAGEHVALYERVAAGAPAWPLPAFVTAAGVNGPLTPGRVGAPLGAPLAAPQDATAGGADRAPAVTSMEVADEATGGPLSRAFARRPVGTKVAVYHPWVYLKGGAERTLLELMRRSRHDWVLYTNHYDPAGTFPEFRDLPVVQLGRVSVRRTVVEVGRASLRALTQRMPLDGMGALMVSSEGLGNLITLRPRGVPVFCFCHTPLKVVYDPFTRDRYFSEHPGWALRTAIGLYTAVDRLGWLSYRRVFCNSREVARRVLGAGLAGADRVEVVYPGVDLQRFHADGPHEPFFLLAGRIARTKTVELAISAFLRLKRQCPAAAPFRLVIAGMVDAKSRSYLSEMRQQAAERSDVEFVVGPTDDELLDLYRRCYATLFTALNEDWGLVALEGMASGKAVVAVARGGPCESVVDGETGLLRPADPAAFADAMAELVVDPGRTAAMGAAGRRRAALFSWGAFVDRIDEYVDSLLGYVEVPAAPPLVPLPIVERAV